MGVSGIRNLSKLQYRDFRFADISSHIYQKKRNTCRNALLFILILEYGQSNATLNAKLSEHAMMTNDSETI